LIYYIKWKTTIVPPMGGAERLFGS